MTLPSVTDVKKLLLNGWWALKLIWATNRPLTAALAIAVVMHGMVPAGLALFARGLINAFLDDGGPASTGMEVILPWLVLGFAVTMVEAVAPLMKKFCLERLRDDVNIRITSDILRHSESLDQAFFEDPRKRNLIDRAQQDPADRFMRFVLEIQMLCTSLLQAGSLAAILIIIEPLVLLALVPFGLPYLIFEWRLSQNRYQQEFLRTPQRRWTRYFVSLLTGRDSVAEVKLLDLSPFLRKKFLSLIRQFRDRDRRNHLRSLGGGSLFSLVTTIAFYLIFLRVIVNVLKGVLTVGDVAVFGTATARLRFTLESAIRSCSTALEQALYISDLIEFFNERPQMRSGSSVLVPPCRGELDLKNVSFTYPGCKEPVLRDISLHVRPGETIALVGENGAGKTTLVKLLARLYDPDEGSIEFDGVDVRTLSLDCLRKQVGFVLQDFGRYEATAGDNIAYGDWRLLLESPEKVEEVARLSGVEPMIQAMPERYATMLGRQFGEYEPSRGQWQQLAIARAFARNASVLILDEPAASLSVQAEYDLFCRFHELSRGRTTILISHRFSTLSIADRIFVMDKGRIVESGTHQALLAQAGLYAKLHRLHRHPLKSMASRRNTGKIVPMK